MNKKGFNYVELLIILAIIVVVSAVARISEIYPSIGNVLDSVVSVGYAITSLAVVYFTVPSSYTSAR